MYRYEIEKPHHGSEEWLRVRWADKQGNRRISASVAAAIHNSHPWTSSASLAGELLADTAPVPKASNKDMERGNRMEPMLIEWAGDLENKKLITPDVMYCYEDGACRMIATLDAIDEQGTPYEVKTTKKRWDGELPDHWRWQGVQQAICAGSTTVEWVIFDGSMELHRYTQFVTSDEMEVHKNEVRMFLSAIDEGRMPDNADPTFAEVGEMYPESQPKSVDLDEYDLQTIEHLKEVKEQIATLEEVESKLSAQIGSVLQDAEIGLYGGEEVITWKTVKRDSLDTKALGQAHPALVNKFRKTTQYRQMKIKKRSK
jgi:predicted phage-related endonuclease